MNSKQPLEDPLSTTSFDDPVPAGAEDSVVMGGAASHHQIASDVQRVLQRLPGVVVDSLAVRELGDGCVLLEGSVHASSASPRDFSGPICEATGLRAVIDRLRVQRTHALDETIFEPPSPTANVTRTSPK